MSSYNEKVSEFDQELWNTDCRPIQGTLIGPVKQKV